MRKENSKVLYISPYLVTFVERDLNMISHKHKLSFLAFKPRKGPLILISFLKQLFHLAFQMPKTDVVVCMFLGYHSFIPGILCKLFQKPMLAILGGTECHNYPSINYGSLRKPVYAWFTRMSFRMTRELLPVHESLVYWEDTYYGVDSPKQGYRYFFPEITQPFTAIYNGYDSEEFKPLPGIVKRSNSFLTVAGTVEGGEYYRKGIDLIVEAAKAFPECSFTIISTDNPLLPKLSNLELIPPMPVKDLLPYFTGHEYYFQLSIAEGFPNAICEAMLCECIPIGSSVYGIPLIIGETGFVLKKKDFTLLKKLIDSALTCDKKALAKAARARISENFTHATRMEKLNETIAKYV